MNSCKYKCMYNALYQLDSYNLKCAECCVDITINTPMRLSVLCKCALSAIEYCSSASWRSFARALMVASFLSTILSNVWLRISRSFFSSLDLFSLMMFLHWWFSLLMLNFVALSSFANLSYFVMKYV